MKTIEDRIKFARSRSGLIIGGVREIRRAVTDYLILVVTMIFLTAIVILGYKLFNRGPEALQIATAVMLVIVAVTILSICFVSFYRIERKLVCPHCQRRNRRRNVRIQLKGTVCSFCQLLIADPGTPADPLTPEEAIKCVKTLRGETASGQRKYQLGLVLLTGTTILSVTLAIIFKAEIIFSVLYSILGLIIVAVVAEAAWNVWTAISNRVTLASGGLWMQCPSCEGFSRIQVRQIGNDTILCSCCNSVLIERGSVYGSDSKANGPSPATEE